MTKSTFSEYVNGMEKSDDYNMMFSDNPQGITEVFSRSTVGIAGLGGIGSNVAVSLVRAGVGKLVIADYDSVELKNLNRQQYFLDQVGRHKVDAIVEILKSIRQDVEIIPYFQKIDPDNLISIFGEAHILVEAFDREEEKVMLVETWLNLFPGKPIVIASGIAGYGKTDLLKVDRRENLIICGDQKSQLSLGTLSSRVCIVANMMANEVLNFLVLTGKNKSVT